MVIWFSDDPSLNEQTRFRLMEASDRLDISDLVVVENTFNREKFEAGKIYFLNTQKLGKKSLLVRGHDRDDDGTQGRQMHARPAVFTIWDTIRNTIEDPALTLYLVLDEAHRGYEGGGGATARSPPSSSGSSTGQEQSRASRSSGASRRRSSGSTRRWPTCRGGHTAARGGGSGQGAGVGTAEGHDHPGHPDEIGTFDTVLVRRATDKLREISATWAEYAKEQEDADPVQPLMVLQVPNTPDHTIIGQALDTIFAQCPNLRDECVAHVFGEHTTQNFGRHAVAYIPPERVQETPSIRVLIAKDAISTGWDCPRAEVMVSFRPARDKTHITQLLGRMVRTPLARRIPGQRAA